jgi:hypothetical protein
LAGPREDEAKNEKDETDQTEGPAHPNRSKTSFINGAAIDGLGGKQSFAAPGMMVHFSGVGSSARYEPKTSQ